MMPKSIYEWVRQEESNFESQQIQVGDNWYFNFRDHVQLIFHLKNGYFYQGENNWLRAFKNIMEPILNLSYWTEDIEVKDVVFFIESSNNKVLSFLLKKYHDEVYTREHDLDTVFDNITESDIDYGGVMVQKGAECPEVLPLNSVAFCDQTDAKGGPIAFKHNFSPTKLKAMSEYGWGEEKNGATISLEDLCELASYEKEPAGMNSNNQVPIKTIEVYIIRGSMPESYLYDDESYEGYCNQVQIIAYYKNKKDQKVGVTLYRKEDDEEIEFFTSKEVYGRALGRGVGESLIHPQIWTNFLTIHKMGLLEAASKVLLQTDDAGFAARNRIQNMENLEITVTEDNKQIRQIPNVAPTNIQLFAADITAWYDQAQLAGAAFDPIMGVQPASGTTFRGQERTVAQGKGLHDRRRGQRAKFIEKLYRQWIIPDMKKEITKGQEFLSTLSSEELLWIREQLAENYAHGVLNEMVLNGTFPENGFEQQKELLKQEFLTKFAKKGSKHMIKILKEDFKDIEERIGITIGNKQKNLADLSDKLLSIFQFVFQNPQAFIQAMKIPALSRSFENILEFSGLSIGDFNTLLTAPVEPIQPEQPQQPQQEQMLAQPVNG